MKIAVAQFNPTVGDIDGNLNKLLGALPLCKEQGAGLVVFPELFLTGYPPRDLLKRPGIMRLVSAAIKKIETASRSFPELGILFGAPLPSGRNIGAGLFNTAFLAENGFITFSQHKMLLPTYDVFDESRYFDPAEAITIAKFRNETLGISICEDAWNDPVLWPRRLYDIDPIEILAGQGATIFINISASPFYMGKEEIRFGIVANHARKHGRPFLFVNQIGANDELVFDGRSLFVDKAGHPAWVGPAFKEELALIDSNSTGTRDVYDFQDHIESVHDALVLGIKDYVRKCGFKKVILSLSGGIDSAVTCVLACSAIGPENVIGVTMPSEISSKGSVEDSRQLAKNLEIEFVVIPIGDINDSYIKTLQSHFLGRNPDITEENIQARIRGNVLMALSNKFGYLVLSTGNKSEMAVGYCTLYGDMSGGLSVISDVPKTMVYRLAEYMNRERLIIPRTIIEKPPSAELRPNQVDQDSLPPYDILDGILHYYVEEGLPSDEIIARGFAPETVRWVVKAIRQSEYKRRQAAPGLKVTSKAFGIGRRMPIAAKY